MSGSSGVNGGKHLDHHRQRHKSRPWRWLAACALVVSQLACNAPAPPAVPPADQKPKTVDARVEIAGPTIIAFLPVEAEQAGYEGAAEAVAHVRFALADTRQCLGGKMVQTTTVFADRLTIRDGAKQRTIELGKLGQGIGAVLAEPGRPENIVYTEVGASSLQYLLPQAAFEYWQQAACKRS